MRHNILWNRHAAVGLATLAALGLVAAPAAHAQAYTLQILASFSVTNWDDPYPSALTLSADGRTIYGTTEFGGDLTLNNGNGVGMVFSIPAEGGALTPLAAFNYSTGYDPRAGLALSADGTKLYGTTYQGGVSGDGTVFSIPVGGGTLTTLASFNYTTGAYPTGGLTLSADGTKLYGVANSGGANGHGTVFSVPIGGGTPTVIASLNSTAGGYAQGGVTLSADGTKLYGAMNRGGVNNAGIVFSVPVGGGTPTPLASFNNANGADPNGGLVLVGSTLYGTALSGGTNNDGVVFSVPANGGTPTALTSFSYAKGYGPEAGLTLRGSTLYGTTGYGGAAGFGTVFSIPVGGGAVTPLTAFNNVNGATPFAAPTVGPDGTLYGTTLSGGLTNAGTVFALVPPSATSQSHPILPSSSSTSGGVTTFTFTGVASGSWVDPTSATGFVYKMTGGSLFTGITGFPTGFSSPFDVTANGKDYGLFTPGQALTFDGAGVSSFLIQGINPAVDGSSPTAFPLQLTFNTLNADFTMMAAPEPSQLASLALGTLGLAGLGLRARRRANI